MSEPRLVDMCKSCREKCKGLLVQKGKDYDGELSIRKNLFEMIELIGYDETVPELGRSFKALGWHLKDHGKIKEAEKEYKKARRMLTVALGRESPEVADIEATLAELDAQ